MLVPLAVFVLGKSSLVNTLVSAFQANEEDDQGAAAAAAAGSDEGTEGPVFDGAITHGCIRGHIVFTTRALTRYPLPNTNIVLFDMW